MAELLFYFIVGIVALEFILDEVLKLYNNRWRNKPVPELLADVYSHERYSTFRKYKQEIYRFSVLISVLSFIASIIMLWGGFALLDDLIRQVTQHKIWLSILFFLSLGLAFDLIMTPFDVYSTFVIEQKYGFNKTTVKTYILDKLKGYMLAILIGVPVAYLAIWLFYRFGHNFWWMVWVVITVFSLLLTFLYSNVIVPLFNKQTPLQEGELKSKIREISDKVGFKLDNIFVIDGSKRSTRANAYFTGFGSKKRIVLYDTLISTHSIEEIISVLAHEIGHYKKRHVVKSMVVSILSTGMLLYLFSLIVENPAIYEALGTPPSLHIGAIVFGILYSPVSFILSLFTNYISRKYEYQADDFAAKHASPDHLIAALKSLTANNLSDLNPHPAYVIAHYSHPTLLQRIINLNKKHSVKNAFHTTAV